MITIKCHACNKEFTAERGTRKYCSDACRYRSKQRAQGRVRVPDAMRWSILKRDGFACRYCGQRPPLVWLRVDHVTPIEHGGKRLDMGNLVTACHWCNNGKSDELFDHDLLPGPNTEPHPEQPSRQTGARRRARKPRAAEPITTL